MPLDTESDEWQNGARTDWMEVYIDQVLREEPEAALTVEEISDKLLEKKSELFPEILRGESNEAVVGRATLISAVLQTMAWLNRVDWRTVDDDIYYSATDGHYPVASVVDEFPMRFSSIEDDVENVTNRLKEEVYNLNYRLDGLERQIEQQN